MLSNVVKTQNKILRSEESLTQQLKSQTFLLQNRKQNVSYNEIFKKQITQPDIQTARFKQQNKLWADLNSKKLIGIKTQYELMNVDIDTEQEDSNVSLQKNFKENCNLLKSLLCFSITSHEQQLIQQIINYRIYKNDSTNFYGIRIWQINFNEIKQLLNEHEVIDIFRYIGALRISRCIFSANSVSLFLKNLKIINISENNLYNISFIAECDQIQFININHNRIKNLNTLQSFQNLVQIHAFDNFIQIPFQQHTFLNLLIFDIGYNQVCDMESIILLKNLTHLKVLNVIGNPIQKKPGFKKQMLKHFPKIKGFEFPQAYIFSDYNRYKDIAFFTQAQKRIERKMIQNRY